MSRHQPTDVDLHTAPVAITHDFEPAAGASTPPRSRDKAKLAAAEEHIIELRQSLSKATARIEALESDVAARQIRETDLAARLLKSERSLRDSITELRKRGQ